MNTICGCLPIWTCVWEGFWVGVILLIFLAIGAWYLSDYLRQRRRSKPSGNNSSPNTRGIDNEITDMGGPVADPDSRAGS